MSLAAGLRYDRYVVDGHSEWLMRIGPAGGVPLLFVPPLFEEMNRTRAFIASIMRSLALDGFECLLPDLPGTGESERALDACSWGDWTDAVRSAADLARAPDGKLLIASVRGGGLLTEIAEAAHWCLAPVEGAALLRDLNRSGLIGGDSQAGYAIPPAILSGLEQAIAPECATMRSVRLTSDPKSADAKLDGPALWRRSEPGNSAEFALLCACDIKSWARQCGHC